MQLIGHAIDWSTLNAHCRASSPPY